MNEKFAEKRHPATATRPPQYIITLHNNISVLAHTVAYRYNRLQYTNTKGKPCFTLRCYVIQVQNIKGIASHAFPDEIRGIPQCHGRPLGNPNTYDRSLKDYPERQAYLNQSEQTRQAREYRRIQSEERKAFNDKECLKDKLRWADW